MKAGMKVGLLLHRGYFLVVACFTLWVGWFGFVRPDEIQRALPWPVPPLHARFIGALYLSATVFLLAAALAPARRFMHGVLELAFVWTGWLLLVSLWHWDRFDPAREQVGFWWVAYVLFPIGAAWLRWGAAIEPALRPNRTAGVIGALQALGALLVLLAVVLALWPASAQALWPWKITPFLAQVYSGPLLGWGVACWLLARRACWAQLPIPMLGLFVLAVLTLLASGWHVALFTPGSPSKALWFGGLVLLAAGSMLLGIAALRQLSGSRRVASGVPA